MVLEHKKACVLFFCPSQVKLGRSIQFCCADRIPKEPGDCSESIESHIGAPVLVIDCVPPTQGQYSGNWSIAFVRYAYFQGLAVKPD